MYISKNDNGEFTVSYENNSRLFLIKTGKLTGFLEIYSSKFKVGIKISKGDLIEKIKQAIVKKLANSVK